MQDLKASEGAVFQAGADYGHVRLRVLQFAEGDCEAGKTPADGVVFFLDFSL
jgi:hypothetical protein